MSLIHCIYASTATPPYATDGWAALVQQARDNNARFDITGMLLAVDHHFVQILEGEADNVDELFLHIVGDPRHTDVQEINRQTIRARRFGAWHLGFQRVDRDALATQPGFVRLWDEVNCLQQLDAKRALELLSTFAGQAEVYG